MLADVVVPALLYLLAVEVCSFAAFPLACRVFGGLADRGYVAAKVLGPLLIVYAVWLLSTLGWLTLARGTLLVATAALAALAWWRYGAETVVWVRKHRGEVLRLEGIFVVVFGLGVAVRMYNAPIIGQEKFMDMAFMNAFLSSERLPTEDPWLAGYSVPYYHFSYLLLGALGKLAGLGATFAYPIALVYVFAVAAAGAGALVANLVSSLKVGAASEQSRLSAIPMVFGAFFVAFCGNLVAPLELLAARDLVSPSFWAFFQVRSLDPLPNPRGLLPADGAWWFHSSRVIPNIEPDGINEFPFFSFLLGDLHPHFTAIPLDLLVLALALNVLRSHGSWRSGLSLAVAALSLGALVVANTWDVVTFWGLFAICGVIAVFMLPGAARLGALGRLGVVYGAAIAAYLPYLLGATAPPLGLGLVAARSPLPSMLVIFGALLLPIVPGIVWLWRQKLGRAGLRRLQHGMAGQGAAVLAIPMLALLALLLFREATLVLVGAFIFVLTPMGVALFNGEAGVETIERRASLQFVWLLLAWAIAVLLGTEILYLSDAFASRMNTVFKFQYNAWLLLGVAAATCASLVVQREHFGIGARFAVVGRTVTVAAIALGLVYPLAATYAKSGAFRSAPTLDGAAFMARSRPGDLAAVAWLRANATGSAVVLEATGDDYSEFARISTFSGVPTVLGWVGHELQWRGPIRELDERKAAVAEAYSAQGRDELLEVLKRYRVRYVIVGDLERAAFGAEVEARIAENLVLVHQKAGTSIYRVPDHLEALAFAQRTAS